MEIKMKDSYDYDGNRSIFIEGLSTKLSQLYNTVSGAKTFRISPTNISYQTMVIVRSSYIDVFKIVDLIDSLEVGIRAGIWMSDFFSDNELKAWLLEKKSEIVAYYAPTCDLLKDLEYNFAIVRDVIQTPEWKMLIRTDKRLIWLETTVYNGDLSNARMRMCDKSPDYIPSFSTSLGLNFPSLPSSLPSSLSVPFPLPASLFPVLERHHRRRSTIPTATSPALPHDPRSPRPPSPSSTCWLR